MNKIDSYKKYAFDNLIYIIKECNLEFKKIIKYAKETNNKKALDKLSTLEK